MATPTQKFNMLYEAFLQWKNEPVETRSSWMHAKAMHFRKHRDLTSRRRPKRRFVR